MTRPLAAMETTARSIAGGDLSARVDTTDVHDDELASLAQAINAMAADLDVARGHERAFLLSVSHDLRTPLTSIRGYAEAIADGTVEGKDARIRAADVISSESRRLERLVADLLDLARLDAHQFSLHPAPVDARAVVARRGRGIRSCGSRARPRPRRRQRRRRARGRRRATARADRRQPGRERAQVRDDARRDRRGGRQGSRRAARRRRRRRHRTGRSPRVFERLYTSRTVPGRTLGTGIGLAIVHELAVAMGGDARVEPLDRVGTRFVVTFPSAVS